MAGFHQKNGKRTRKSRPWYEYQKDGLGRDFYHQVTTHLDQQAVHEDRVVVSLSESRFLPDEVDDPTSLHEAVQEAMPQAQLRTYHVERPRKAYGIQVWEWDQGAMQLRTWSDSKSCRLQVATTDRKGLEALYPALDAFRAKTQIRPPQGSVGVLMRSNPTAPLQIRNIGTGGVPLQRDNYAPKVLEAYDKIVAEFRNPNPFGRIVLFGGPPGTGKTFLIKALLHEVFARFILIQPKLLPELSDPEVLLTFTGEDNDGTKAPIILIAEDADSMLTKRGHESGSLVSILNALSIGDGLIGDLLDIRLVATTNVVIDDLDPAILRPGRLSANVEVESLDYHQALKAWENIGSPAPLPRRETYSLAELYAQKHQGLKE